MRTITDAQWDALNMALAHAKTCVVTLEQQAKEARIPCSYAVEANDAIERGLQTLINLPVNPPDVAFCGDGNGGAAPSRAASPVTLAPKDVEMVLVEIGGDPSVGIPHASHEASVWIPKGEDIEWLRAELKNIYELMCDGPVSVLFDFELEARDRQEREMEEAEARDERSLQ